MKLTIEGPTGPILECGGLNVLTPQTEGERALAFGVLTRALELLIGITPPSLSVAREAATDEHCEESGQYRSVQSSGNVVPLAGRRAFPTRATTTE